MQAKDILSIYIDDYFDAIRAFSYDDLERCQQGFHASLAYGAAGIAYACWYAGRVLGDRGLLDEAERWVRSAVDRQRKQLAFLVPTARLRQRPPSHFLYGRVGLSFVQVLVAHAKRNQQAQAFAVSQFAELARLSKQGSPELYNGAAGCLAGSAILLREIRDPRLQSLGSELAENLISRAVEVEDGLILWPELTGLGLSHGNSGAYLAILLWAVASGTALPEWFTRSLESLLASALRNPTKLCPDESSHSYFCNGFSGLAFLGARACLVLSGEGLLDAAAESVRRALERLTSLLDLCCGRTGVAFSCLALSQVDPAGPWRKGAEDLALSVLLLDQNEWPYTGLYGGEAAIACLALNLTSGLPGGPPCLDFVVPY